MGNKKASFGISIVKSLSAVPRQDWERIFLNKLEGFGYQKTLEESGLANLSIRYLLGKENQKIIGIIPFFIMDFSFDIFVPPAIRKVFGRLMKKIKARIIFFGTITAEEFSLGLDKDIALDSFLDRALQEIDKFLKQEKIQGIAFYNVSLKNNLLINYLKKRAFCQMENLPSTILKINASSLEEYINSLSRNMRKDLRRKLKKSESAGLTTVIREDISDIYKDIYKLYLNNFLESDIHFEKLTEDFFKKICQNMPQEAKFFITYEKEKIVAFNLCLIKDNICIDKFVGFDPQVAHKYHLYFFTFCQNISWCIKNKIGHYQPGATDYLPKVRLGAKLIPLYVYSKASNPLLNLMVRIFSGLLQAENIDPSLKHIQKAQVFKPE